VRHNNDVTIDVKTFWLASVFAVLMAKKGTVHKNCSYFKVTRTRDVYKQNPYYCERLSGLLEYM